MVWKTDLIRYNVHLPLGSGGSRIGQYKTLAEAKEAVKQAGRNDLQIWKTYYHKGNDGKYRSFLSDQV